MAYIAKSYIKVFKILQILPMKPKNNNTFLCCKIDLCFDWGGVVSLIIFLILIALD